MIAELKTWNDKMIPILKTDDVADNHIFFILDLAPQDRHYLVNLIKTYLKKTAFHSILSIYISATDTLAAYYVELGN